MEKEGIDGEDEKGAGFVAPARMYLKKVGKDGDRLRISFSDDLGGSYLVYTSFLRDLLDGKRAEVYSAFVPDSAEWIAKKKMR